MAETGIGSKVPTTLGAMQKRARPIHPSLSRSTVVNLNRSLQSIFRCSSLDYDYDARQEIDRVLVPRRDAADPALRIAVAGWAVTSGCGMSNLIRFGINRSLQSILCSSTFDYDYDARHKIDRAVPLSIAIGIAIETSRPSSTRAKRTVWLLHSERHPTQAIGNGSIAIAIPIARRTNPRRR